MTNCNNPLATEQNISDATPAARGQHLCEKTEGYSVGLYADFLNKRLKVLTYMVTDYDAFGQYLHTTAMRYELTKIILIARQQDWQSLFRRGFILEALHPSFFCGEPGYHLAKFLSADRRASQLWDKEDDILRQVQQLSSEGKALPPDYEIRSARSEEAPALADLYAGVFETYPTPITDPRYIKKVMQTHTHFKIVLHKGNIVSAASLDVDPDTKSAELTDCATLPSYRGLSLMSHLVSRLEKKAAKLGLITVYTIARAASIGINAVFYRHGYTYYGRFVNNCEICGKFEDMNLWSKQLTLRGNPCGN